jgi:hypothetical protein
MSGAYAPAPRFNGRVRTYLDPTAPIAADALVVDDPKVAMDLAVALCEKPRMSNLSHGLWGYHGAGPDGFELTVQSLGIGGPSAAAVTSDLAELGVARAIRIGSCIAIDPELELGSALLATSFEPRDGTGATLAGAAPLVPSAELAEALAHAASPHGRGVVRSVDVVRPKASAEGGPAALDQSSAAFAAACRNAGIACAAAVVVARSAAGTSLEREALDEALISLGTRAAGALGALAQASGS